MNYNNNNNNNTIYLWLWKISNLVMTSSFRDNQLISKTGLYIYI